MIARLIDWPPRRTLPETDTVADEMRITGLAIYLATITGEDWRLVSDTRMGQLERIARLALSAARGNTNGDM